MGARPSKAPPPSSSSSSSSSSAGGPRRRASPPSSSSSSPPPPPPPPPPRSSGWEKGELLLSSLGLGPPRPSSAPAPAAPAEAGAPYLRRVGLIQEMLRLARQGRPLEANALLRRLRQDLGMESTSLDDVLYRYASFRNLVDPITHDLLISLARCIHCPKPEGEALGALEKLCRQLTYHLSPHAQLGHPRRGPGLAKKKPQASLKALLCRPLPPSGSSALDLSGIPLGAKELERLSAFLGGEAGRRVESLSLAFTELTDELFLGGLLPALAPLPALAALSLNGNRLTRAVLREMTEALKDPRRFPRLAWVDLGNNEDIFSLPQPFLLALRRRCPPAQGALPTILEAEPLQT
uniref:Leucine rich repeat containing 75A n=1 Tax=Anolis carolinensis TaxID=28377 RepID=A0A803TAH4_ANOCA|nr:PREDICTED: leucine-rich repeat-containing protein 75A [Anolis carolinensis]|eukprot:XP_008123238.1 PREDICTED: leucine-rich repeat-containing protein 75A [Anolis carolinensis]